MSSVQDEAITLDRSFFYAVVPLSPKEKKPYAKDWQKRSFGKGDFKPNDNIGVKLGEPSGWLVDVDLDDPIALQLADEYLPPTGAVTGRPSAPRSHRWYVCRGAQNQRRSLSGHGMIVELRSTGCQTVVGPSIHPSGEPYDRLRGQPAEIDADTLVAAVERLYQAVAERLGVQPADQPETPRLPVPWELPAQLAPQPALVQAAPQPEANAGDVIIGQRLWSLEDRIRRASAYIRAMPPSIQGQVGSGPFFAACVVAVHGFLLPLDVARRVVLEYLPADPPWTNDREIDHKLSDAADKPHDQPAGWLLLCRYPGFRRSGQRPAVG